MHSAFSSEVEASPARKIRPENPDHHDRLSSPRRLIRRLVHERDVQHLSRNVPPGGPRVRRVADYRGATSALGTTCRRSRTSCQALNLPDVQRHLVATCLRPAPKPGTHCHPIADPAASREKQIVYRLPQARSSAHAKATLISRHAAPVEVRRSPSSQFQTLTANALAENSHRTSGSLRLC